MEGTTRANLADGPGHHLDSPWLGASGNTVIAGHRTSHGAPFYDLDKLKVGDLISVTDVQGRVWAYRVRENPFIVDDEEVAAVYSQPIPPELTLVTCTPIGSTAQRLVVKADLVEVPA